jgi:hypothetical protein
MAAWALIEINVDDDGNVEVSGYNADPAPIVEGAESWEELLSTLCGDGWELVQVVPDDDTTYWFKKQA